ncbi:NADH-ubiquinone oxidoreductase 20.8 kDA subunit [Colletotrichum liriopes]|uniref:NADH-ubiquinone oxidoreductase 20.8 kDa subunit n=1 Tax=Colletotrichum liriopes TaxID=708192 RepID=A0AA37GPZ6_9PEZI|nr:NADH-ubiquinone oxidoreductase 20.8 kDA subunit [Colletotrichum liriopes]
MASRRPQFNQQVQVDTTPLPDDIPKVKEIGASSAPLLSASYFIGARCREYNDDFMQCKTDSAGRGEFDCLKEGRRVTRCASSVLKDINTHCLEQFKAHWTCIENRNHQLYQCRQPEWKLNKCVFENLKLEKHIPNQRPGVTPVELRPHMIYADQAINTLEGKPFIPRQRPRAASRRRKRCMCVYALWEDDSLPPARMPRIERSLGFALKM